MEVVGRTKSRLGENRYRLTTDSCEHYREWCIAGVARSAQMEKSCLRPRVAAAAVRWLKECVVAGRNTPTAAVNYRRGNCATPDRPELKVAGLIGGRCASSASWARSGPAAV